MRLIYYLSQKQQHAYVWFYLVLTYQNDFFFSLIIYMDSLKTIMIK
jgi:hypothetical protein